MRCFVIGPPRGSIACINLPLSRHPKVDAHNGFHWRRGAVRIGGRPKARLTFKQAAGHAVERPMTARRLDLTAFCASLCRYIERNDNPTLSTAAYGGRRVVSKGHPVAREQRRAAKLPYRLAKWRGRLRRHRRGYEKDAERDGLDRRSAHHFTPAPSFAADNPAPTAARSNHDAGSPLPPPRPPRGADNSRSPAPRS